MYQSIKYVPKVVGILGSMVVVVILFLLPLIDRSKERHPKRRPVAISLGIASILVVLIFSVLGHLAESTRTIFGTKYHFDIKSIPNKELSKMPEVPAAKSGQEQVNP
jgi:quinol-cytochrome oxidoreductase complex cytochrome b subunit